ncbi:MAG: 50S ribosomal protein L10 [Planctomycetota bacterium]
MSRILREKILHELKEQYSSVNCGIFVNFDGLSSEVMNQLRGNLHKKGYSLNVRKNSLLKLALEEAAKTVDSDFFSSPTAVAFGEENPFELFRLLIDWEKKTGKLKVKGGFFEGKSVTSADISSLSLIPSKESLLSRLAGAINSPATRIVSCVNSVLIKVCATVKAYSEKLEEPEKK